ncbi:hypothetical protein RI543_001178 [Arxiozyma heterogenica]|uniref:Uncharacterized protein n=1 Tax=Arxiozyma heterogenica TaxID=278026 RepID=A0AAN8A7R9_9SACH|nr:hypothetical protein RI543_001178 [Kazachstania heterogenica]
MSSDTMYFNRSRMLPAHNKNKSHLPQPSPLSMKRYKSNRKSLEMMGRRSERESRSSTPTPMDLNLPEIPKLQVLPNGQKPNFGNSSNNNYHHHHNNNNNSSSSNNNNSNNNNHHHHGNNSHSHGHSHNHNQINKNNDLATTQNKSHSRKRSSSGGKSFKKDKETDVDKRNRNTKRDSHKKADKTNIESAEDVTNQLKNLLINNNNNNNNNSKKKSGDNLKNNVTDLKNMSRVQNNPSPLTTFLTSPIITPETIPPQLKIENNSILGKTPLLVSIQQTTQTNNTNTQQQQQSNHKILNNSKVVNHASNNIAPLPLQSLPAPVPTPTSNPTTSTMNANGNPPLPILNGIVHSPIMQPLTSFQVPNNVPPLPFGNNNMNYSITNVPLPIPPFMAPPPSVSHQNPLNSPNLLNARDSNTNVKNVLISPELILNEDVKKTSKKSYNTRTNTITNNILNKHSKCTAKKTSHTFAGASFATDIPQECNLPKPSFL